MAAVPVTRRMLTTSDPRANAELAKLAEQIGASPPTLATVYRLIVVRRGDTPLYLLRAVPLPPELCDTFTGARAMLLVQSLAPRTTVGVAGLAQSIYRLTPAE